ncbi:hypothetical protein JCM9152_1279 [Halalkalibacter hemicellulosilyticusJCM 9152]|uniref:DUF4025 domain-containing protein n=1 Tax=Halalkalibacter hemicellulosilyticusJCM 9152 TaxID=1236971 RepID=W4QD67_9BACI|nr:hypothetical protein JCM9152_1279 [Halalkalibacter hemicellulosilyticusJCM 9152]
MLDKTDKQRVEEMATKSYQPSYYKSENETEKGIAVTHEQVSDTLTEGTIENKNEAKLIKKKDK